MNHVTRTGYIVAVAHCILNQTTRWFWEGEGGWVEGFVAKFLEEVKSLGVGLYQLPCPEFSFLGNPRRPMTKEEYEHLPKFKEYCRSLAEKAAADLTAFIRLSRTPKLRVLAIIGIEGSPTCGVRTTSRRICGESVRVLGKGIFIDILEQVLESEGLSIALYGLDLKRVDETVTEVVRILKGFL